MARNCVAQPPLEVLLFGATGALELEEPIQVLSVTPVYVQ